MRTKEEETPIPQVSTLLDECRKKLATMVYSDKLTAGDLEKCINMLIAIDKNNRDFATGWKKRIANMTPEELQELEADVSDRKAHPPLITDNGNE